MIRADWAELTRNEILRVVVTLTALVNILSYGVTKANHHFTGSKENQDKLVAVGWKYEGIGWYSLFYGI